MRQEEGAVENGQEGSGPSPGNVGVTSWVAYHKQETLVPFTNVFRKKRVKAEETMWKRKHQLFS